MEAKAVKEEKEEASNTKRIKKEHAGENTTIIS